MIDTKCYILLLSLFAQLHYIHLVLFSPHQFPRIYNFPYLTKLSLCEKDVKSY